MRVDTTKVQNDATKVRVNTTKVQSDATNVQVDATKVRVDTTKVQSDATNVQVDARDLCVHRSSYEEKGLERGLFVVHLPENRCKELAKASSYKGDMNFCYIQKQ
ncbi:hypothetical protein [Nostoc sp. ChiVER01]|uniref:hypothetical protein n=1 Tax=Nostoc sp. ChiVER01 TaxID=3075382 RepID=UPI002AD224C0|nr:hypothetical protein [Nostoc sp. ChiVER01]MDZ8221493.1 hypothetical protein [Nostoc sp. ChiVER01]